MSDDAPERAEPQPDAAAEEGEDLLELVLAEHERTQETPARIDGVVVGRLSSIGAGGEPVVIFPGSPREDGLPARALCAATTADVGREVALLFEGGDPSRPVLMGLIHQAPIPGSSAAPEEPRVLTAETLAAPPVASAERDGERLVFEADKEIVLRCGKAQITLTRAGKILIKGAYLLARSTGVNRIQGGSVQIN